MPFGKDYGQVTESEALKMYWHDHNRRILQTRRVKQVDIWPEDGKNYSVRGICRRAKSRRARES